MSESKISPAFEPYLARSGPHDRREAIVIYHPPAKTAALPIRGRLRQLQARLSDISARASAQKPVEQKIVREYRKEASQLGPDKGSTFSAASIGKSALPVASIEVTPSTLMALANRPNVLAILPNQRVRLIQPRSISFTTLNRRETKDRLTWGLKRLGIPEAWKTTKGRDINVAVLDTGVYADHEALKDRVKKFVIIDPLGRRIELKDDCTFDGGSHGTHVCGTIAGGTTPDKVAIGVAPEANLLVAGALIGDATLKTVFEAISWAVENGADVISMSLGFAYYEPLFEQVFTMLLDQYNVLPVAAIGNENHGNTSSPGSSPSALSVGAAELMPFGRLDVAPFSSGASLVFPRDETSGLVTKPDVVAPGVQVFSCIPPEERTDGEHRYAHFDGSSMATPHVAGAAALLMAAHPTASARQVAQALKETAHHPKGASYRPDNRWGFGFIRPAEALKALQ